MARFHVPLSLDDKAERILGNIEETAPEEVHKLLPSLLKGSKSHASAILPLALASAKWVDHGGPLIGHGILNADPTIRAMELLGNEDRDLALLHYASYASHVIRDPNYGPYIMPEIQEIQMNTEMETRSEFIKSLRSGKETHRSQGLMAGLYSLRGRRIADDLIYEGLMQFGENEHRLLLPYHTIKLLNRDNNWKYAGVLLRPSVQYLSTAPDISHGIKAEQLSRLVDFRSIMEKGDKFNQDNAYDLSRMLLNSTSGNEMTVIADYAKSSTLKDMYEAVALSSTVLLVNSHLEQHSVTGKHCILDLITARSIPENVRILALLNSLEGPRARRIKTYLGKTIDSFMKIPVLEGYSSPDDLLQDLRESMEAGKQDDAFRLAGSYVRMGFDPDRLTSLLLSVVFHTEGSIEALHTSKMIVGMRDVTVNSQSGLKWIHLAQSASFVAEMSKKEKKEAVEIMDMFRLYQNAG